MHSDSSHALPGPQFGRILVQQGVVTEEQLLEVLSMQRTMSSTGRAGVPRMGEIFVQKGYATAEQVRDALAQQNRRILFCGTCNVHVNVDLRPDVKTYRCGRCETALTEPPSMQHLKVVESTIMIVLRDPIPAEVQARVQDPQAKFGKYIVISELGRGGVGVVYKAWDTYLGQFVALKRLKSLAAQHKEMARETHVSSLLKEARSAVRLRHPHIATVYDVGRIGREFYMSMEYLEGRTMARHLQDARSQGHTTPFYDASKRYLRAMRDVCRAVHYAHTRPVPVIHCDLKPSNIFIDSNDRAFVLDFGLARSMRGLQDEPMGAVSGTPSYMAPEQASGHTEDIDPRTDVYGIGAVMYELLTGRPPFLGSVVSVLRKSLAEMPERPVEVLRVSEPGQPERKIPAGLEDLALKCLEKERTMRYPTAHAVADAIEQIVKGAVRAAAPTVKAPVIPPPAPRPVRARGLLMFAAGALATALVFSAIAFPAWLRRNEPLPTPPPPSEPDRLVAQAIAFRPDLALQQCRAAIAATRDADERAKLEALAREFEWMELARGRVLQWLDATHPKLPELRLRSGRLSRVEVLKATPSALIVYTEGHTQEVDWAVIEPQQILALLPPDASSLILPERLGLALYARRAGDPARARALLDSLKGTELESVAAEWRE